jgi:hypothetical protein
MCELEVPCTECGLVHRLERTTVRDRIPSAWLGVALLLVSLATMGGLTAEGFAFRCYEAERRESAVRIARANVEFAMLLNAIDNDASSADPKLRNTEAFRTVTKLVNSRGATTPPGFPWWYVNRGLSAWVGAGAAFLAACVSLIILLITRIRRHGEPTPGDVRGRKRLIILWAVFLLLAWLIAAAG